MIENSHCHPALAARIAAFSPELRLLLAASHLAPESLRAVQADRITSLCRAGIDWEVFLELVHQHGVAGLVAATLPGAPSGMVPEWAREALKKSVFRMVVRALQHAAELTRLNEVFSRNGIDLMHLKGPTLSQRLYGNPAARDLCDLDVMVRLEDLPRAEAVMEQEGFQCIDPGFPMTLRMRTAILEKTHHFHYHHRVRNLHVELHWRHDFWTTEQIALVWERRVRMPWAGGETQELDDDALLLFLCFHGAKHTWLRSKWLSDIVAILGRKRAEPWDRLFQLAAALDQERALAQAAVLVRDLYLVPLPEPLTRFIEAQDPPPVVLLRPLFTLQLRQGRESRFRIMWNVVARLKYELCLTRRTPLTSHIRLVWFHPEDMAEIRLPDQWFWLYAVLAPLLWARRRLMGPRWQRTPSPTAAPAQGKCAGPGTLSH